MLIIKHAAIIHCTFVKALTIFCLMSLIFVLSVYGVLEKMMCINEGYVNFVWLVFIVPLVFRWRPNRWSTANNSPV